MATNIAAEESVQMEESMNKIEELFAAAKDEVCLYNKQKEKLMIIC